jgi:hypothetical protein
MPIDTDHGNIYIESLSWPMSAEAIVYIYEQDILYRFVTRWLIFIYPTGMHI